MWFLLDKVDAIKGKADRIIDLLARLIEIARGLSARQDVIKRTIDQNDEQILLRLNQLIAKFDARPAYVAIYLGGTMPLQVGSSSTATVVILDQFGQPFPNFDFGANPPQWNVSDPSVASVAPGSTPDTETITANAAGSETLSVTVPGVANPSATLSFTTTAPAAVPTSVQITTSPDITG